MYFIDRFNQQKVSKQKIVQDGFISDPHSSSAYIVILFTVLARFNLTDIIFCDKLDYVIQKLFCSSLHITEAIVKQFKVQTNCSTESYHNR
ncbi:hypothetical protein GDO78_018773 [Eleutherodactylus coqui]|uniref:Uncharacterized protein n=1 Tax=Eleutherodactylus coqui TaxID=57060 RepID=A0A8J6BDE5_ELECQ|nr:hypothetical protein GDO78_018773 [Eleutherodactylus coqui]